MAQFETRESDGFRFIDEGPPTGQVVVMLHGMLGGLQNWTSTIKAVSEAGHRAIAPLLPVYGLPLEQTSVAGLAEYTARFLEALKIENPVLVGNSLGGHVALVYTISSRQTVSGLVLTGASGIHEVIMGNSKLKRYDREYVRQKAALTFNDPKHVTDELIEGVLKVVWDRPSAIRLIKIARSAKTDTVADHLGSIRVPSLLIWGRQDQLTPPEVAIDFQKRMQNARLEFIDQCGHAPMIEQPEAFSSLLLDYISSPIG
jgi:2-hydroxy-6-oxonona-2,4-dienedioate hydrolase